MKKKFIRATFVAAIAMVCGINVFNSLKSDTLSDIALANVEALAVGEGEGTGGNAGSSIVGKWIVTIYSTTHWQCNKGGGICCPEFDC